MTLRRFLNRLNPTRQLPKPMRVYLAQPGRLVLAWFGLIGLLLGAAMLTANPRQTAGESPEPAPFDVSGTAAVDTEAGAVQDQDPAPEDAPAPAAEPAHTALAGSPDIQLPQGSTISVSGQTPFSLSRNDDRVIITASGQGPLQLTGSGEELRVETAGGGLVYRLKIKAGDQGKIYDASGTQRFRLKCETEDGEDTCKLYDAAGNQLNRVKIKADSFNVYGAGSERLYKGKFKNGAYVVRDDADRTALTVRGAGSLREAALLAMPVEPAIRALLWRHAGR